MYLFKSATDNAWIFGESVNSLYPAGVLSLSPVESDTKIIIRNLDGTVYMGATLITDMQKESGNYTDIAELRAATKDFFFRLGTSVVSESQLVLTNGSTGIKTRIIATTTGYRIDVTLTATGFDGTESTDGGVTGDWVTTASA